MNSSLTLEQQDLTHRKSDWPVDAQFISRWSPRAFDITHELPLDHLMTLFEAARWAPSAFNVQPWRFIYAIRGDAFWPQFLEALDPFNAEWAQRAGALVFLISSKITLNGEPPRELRSHSFDAGAAWIQLALQAQSLGYHAHAIGGFIEDKARKALAIPSVFKIEVAIAIGKITHASVLPDAMRDREIPSTRKPLQDIVYAGRVAS